jgi:hypothetical protein
MTKEQFPFVVGYTGNTAIIDKRFRARFKNKNVKELADAGQYKAAYCLAMYGADEEKEYIAERYNSVAKTHYAAGDLARLFGVFSIPEVGKVRAL